MSNERITNLIKEIRDRLDELDVLTNSSIIENTSSLLDEPEVVAAAELIPTFKLFRIKSPFEPFGIMVSPVKDDLKKAWKILKKDKTYPERLASLTNDDLLLNGVWCTDKTYRKIQKHYKDRVVLIGTDYYNK